MRYVLENEQIRAEIESFGGELKSLADKGSGQEYMWEADPAFWGKTSPVLFPFIGKLAGGAYRYGGKKYEIEKHGFVRDMEFIPTDRQEESITFYLESSEDTLRKYPFPFRLEIAYKLEGRNLKVSWRIVNRGTETMYFSMGGHPAFACPLKGGGEKAGKSRTDCFLKLYGKDLQPFSGRTVQSTEIMVPEGLLTGSSFPVEVKDSLIRITEHIFDKDALCLEKQGVGAIGICDAGGREYVRLEAECPVWGVWSVPDSRGAYVCLEPWWGICDSNGYAGTLQERPYTNAAEAGETWEQGFIIRMS